MVRILAQAEFYSSNLSGSMLIRPFFGPLFSKARPFNKGLKGPYIGLWSNALLTARASLSILFRAMRRAAARLS